MAKKKIDFEAEFDKQQAAGVDIADPLNNLITKPGKPAKKKAEPKPKREAAEAKQEPKREAAADKLAGFVPEAAAGKRSKRVQLVMTPELYDRTKTAADRAGISLNEFINQLCNRVTQ